MREAGKLPFFKKCWVSTSKVIYCNFIFQVRQYIQCVNGRNALTMNHKEVAKEIMKGPIVDLVIMVHFRSVSHD